MTGQLPSTPAWVVDNHPELWAAYSSLGEATATAGPLDARTRRLIKLALAIGVRSEGAVHSHTRRAIDEGVTVEELRHIALLAIPTMGFPQAMAALSWIADVTDEEKAGTGT